MQIKKILIPIDGSNRSYKAVKYAFKFAKNFKECSLTICHVINDEILRHLANYKNVDIKSINEFYEEQAEIYLKKATDNAKDENFDESLLNTIVLRGDPSDQIIDKSEEYDLIIMTLKSKDDVKLIGHVATRVINSSKIPVLVM